MTTLCREHAEKCHDCAVPILDEEGNPQYMSEACAAGAKLLTDFHAAENNYFKIKPAPKARARRVEVNTIDYESSHGHAPRGRGGWLFSTVDPRYDGNYLDKLITGKGTYGDAKREAVGKARAMGLEMIWTCA